MPASDAESAKPAQAPVPCQVCGRPYAPQRRLDQVAKRYPAAGEYLATCPDCRRKAEARKMAHACRRARAAAEAHNETC